MATFAHLHGQHLYIKMEFVIGICFWERRLRTRTLESRNEIRGVLPISIADLHEHAYEIHQNYVILIAYKSAFGMSSPYYVDHRPLHAHNMF